MPRIAGTREPSGSPIPEPMAPARRHTLGDQVPVLANVPPPLAPEGTRWIRTSQNGNAVTYELIRASARPSFERFADVLERELWSGRLTSYGIKRALSELPPQGHSDARDSSVFLYETLRRMGPRFEREAARIARLPLGETLGLSGE